MRTCRQWGFLVDDGFYLCGICLGFIKTYLLFSQDPCLSIYHRLKENSTGLKQTVGQGEDLREALGGQHHAWMALWMCTDTTDRQPAAITWLGVSPKCGVVVLPRPHE